MAQTKRSRPKKPPKPKRLTRAQAAKRTGGNAASEIELAYQNRKKKGVMKSVRPKKRPGHIEKVADHPRPPSKQAVKKSKRPVARGQRQKAARPVMLKRASRTPQKKKT